MTFSARPLAFVSLLACAAAPLAAQHRHGGDDRPMSCRDSDRESGDDAGSRYCEIRNAGFKAGGAVKVSPGENGAIRITGWDRDSVDVIVRVQAQADDEATARQIAQQVRVARDGDRLNAEGPGYRRHESWSVSYEIRAPRRTNLDLTTLNGPLAVEDLTGTLRLSAVNGPLTLAGLGGDVHAHAQNGPLDVTLQGQRWDGAGLDAETQNGPLTLNVPDGYNAALETGTINGPMEIDFPVTVQGRIGTGARRHLTTTLGSGGPPVRVVTTNGPAVIRRS